MVIVGKDAYEKISASLDRFQEAHFWIHMLESYYHSAEPFRWHLNVFIKAIKEIPQLLKMELQNEAGFTAWFNPYGVEMAEDPLLKVLAKQRDFIVHRGMLSLKSHGTIGITEGRGIKLGLTMPIHPLEDSDDAMMRYLAATQEQGDLMALLVDDEDSLPCVHREWRIGEFEEEIVDVCSAAWLRVGETIDAILRWLGADPPPLSLGCRHSDQRVRYKLFKREELADRLTKLKAPAGQE